MTEEKLIVWHPSSRASEELRKAIWEELSTINNPVKIMETNFSSMISLFFFFFFSHIQHTEKNVFITKSKRCNS